MFSLGANTVVYVHRAPIDFRKNINGLAAMVEHEMKLDPFSDACFVFSNKRRDRIKILFWQRNGFWLCQKRLEQERFVWPRRDDVIMRLSLQQLQWLLDGFDLNAMRGHVTQHYLRSG